MAHTWPSPGQAALLGRQPSRQGQCERAKRATRQGLGNVVWSRYEEENRQREENKEVLL